MIDRLCAPPAPDAFPMRSSAASCTAAAPSFLSWVQPAAAEQTQAQMDAEAPHPHEQGDDRPHVPWHENPNPNVAIANRNVDASAGPLSDPVGPAPLDTAAIDPLQRSLNGAGGTAGLMETFAGGPGSMIEMRIQGESGVAQVISTPWKLMATGEIEYSIASVGNPAGTPVPSTAVVQPRLAQRIDTPVRTTEARAFAGLSAADGTSVADGMYRNESSTAKASMRGRSPDEMLSISQALPATADWLSRWFRWVERDGRDLALWVRDYRIGDREAAGVVKGVLAFVREHGIPVGRIVVNGREHWSRQPSQDHEEPQTCR